MKQPSKTTRWMLWTAGLTGAFIFEVYLVGVKHAIGWLIGLIIAVTFILLINHTTNRR